MKPAYTYRATVMRIYDGDTIFVDLDLGCGVHLKGANGKGEALRLYGINTPELRGEERPEGLVAKDRVVELIPVGTEIVVETLLDKSGKYGRLLATIFFARSTGLKDRYETKVENPDALDTWVNLNELLVSQGLAERATY